jgi:phage terminase small subunit
MPPRGKKNLTEQEERFVRAYVLGKPGVAGNGTKAAQAAGYSPRSATMQGSRLIRRANVQRAIHAMKLQRVKQEVATAQERDLVASTILRNPHEESYVRLLAIKELNKVEGRHSVKLIHEGTLTLEQALAATKHPDDV